MTRDVLPVLPLSLKKKDCSYHTFPGFMMWGCWIRCDSPNNRCSLLLISVLLSKIVLILPSAPGKKSLLCTKRMLVLYRLGCAPRVFYASQCDGFWSLCFTGYKFELFFCVILMSVWYPQYFVQFFFFVEQSSFVWISSFLQLELCQERNIAKPLIS